MNIDSSLDMAANIKGAFAVAVVDFDSGMTLGSRGGSAEFDLDFLDRHRAAWGFFRDRRTDLYDVLG